MKKALIAALLLCSPAHAGDLIPDRLTVLVGSKHIGVTGFNETNPGLLVTWNLPDDRWSVTGGMFLNSYGRTSTAAFVSRSVYRKGRFEASVFAGIAHYPFDGRRQIVHVGDVVPMGGVELRYGYFALQAYPMFGGGMKGMVSGSLVIPLK